MHSLNRLRSEVLRPFLVRLGKGLRLLSDGSFRGAKLRQYCLPMLSRVYPRIECIGLWDNDGNLVLAHVRDRFITSDLVKYGENATSAIRPALGFLLANGYSLGGVFVDVGANIGTETLTAMKSGHFSRALAVEPEKMNFRMLGANVALNGLQDRIHLVNAAVSDREGFVALNLSDTNKGDHRVMHVGSQNGATSAVPCNRLDFFLSSYGVPAKDVSLVWIDVQGFEGYVLSGASSVLDAGVPFVCEFDPGAMRAANSYDLFFSAVHSRFSSFVDLRSHSQGLQDIRSLQELGDSLLASHSFTDLLLLRASE